MRKVEKWLWKYRWAGRNRRGTIYMTEEQVKKEHPEAVRIEGSMKVFEEPETEEEKKEAWRLSDTAAFRKGAPPPWWKS
jgi:hypothetical protein